MEKSLAARKRKKWGDQPCKHIALDKETDLGKETGNWACIKCGRSMDPIAWDRLRYGMSQIVNDTKYNDNSMSCRLFGCNGKITARIEAKKEAVHFDCEFGHKFHTDLRLKDVDVCDCD
jgi:hypothetical protein